MDNVRIDVHTIGKNHSEHFETWLYIMKYKGDKVKIFGVSSNGKYLKNRSFSLGLTLRITIKGEVKLVANFREQLRGFNAEKLSYEDLILRLNAITKELKIRNDVILQELEKGTSRKDVCKKYGIDDNRLRQLIYRRKKK